MIFANPLILFGAEEGTRTPTGVTLLDPESSASTNSATSACNFKSIENSPLLFYIFEHKVKLCIKRYPVYLSKWKSLKESKILKSPSGTLL